MTRSVVCDWMYVRVRSAVVKTELKLQIHTESVCSQSHTNKRKSEEAAHILALLSRS